MRARAPWRPPGLLFVGRSSRHARVTASGVEEPCSRRPTQTRVHCRTHISSATLQALLSAELGSARLPLSSRSDRAARLRFRVEGRAGGDGGACQDPASAHELDPRKHESVRRRQSVLLWNETSPPGRPPVRLPHRHEPDSDHSAPSAPESLSKRSALPCRNSSRVSRSRPSSSMPSSAAAWPIIGKLVPKRTLRRPPLPII
jgi:hypothetical protein